MDSYTNVSGQCCGFCGRTVCAPSGRNCGCMQQDPVPLPSYSYDQNWNNSSMPMPTPSFRSDNMSDAMPDYTFMPAPAPAPAPETPVLPAVQDAKLIQTGTSGWLADLMLGAGMVLSAAGYWMERKRKAMFYKSQH